MIFGQILINMHANFHLINKINITLNLENLLVLHKKSVV